MIYLATPYSDPNAEIREWRYQQACALWQHYMLQGVMDVFSPIVHAHPTAVKYRMPTDHEFWLRWNYGMIAASRELWLAALTGWEQSKGMAAERKYAESLGKKVIVLNDAQRIVEQYGLGSL